MESSAARGVDQHAAPFRENDQREHVRGCDALQRAWRRNQYIRHVQADLTETLEERGQVF